MTRKHEKKAETRNGQRPAAIVRDEELAEVAGGTLSSAVSSAIKALGEALSTMARKQ